MNDSQDVLLWVNYPDGCVSDEVGPLPLVGELFGTQLGEPCYVERVAKLDDDPEMGPTWDVFLKLGGK